MDTKSFKDLCDRLLKKNGFKKRRNMYYKDGIDGIRCGVYRKRRITPRIPCSPQLCHN